MARRMSNRDRLERLREEAEIGEREKKKARATPTRKSRAKSSEPARFKFVWAVKDGAGEIVAVYPYARKPAAEAEAEKRKQAERRHFMVLKHKVPFDD